MRRLLAITLAFFIASFAGAALAQAELATPVHLAGEQRMLSQRIAKLYSQIGLNVLPSLATNQLRLASSRFELNLAALKPAVAGSPEATRAYERLAVEWLGLQKAVAEAVSRDAAEALARQSEATLAAAEQLTRMVEGQGKSDASGLVNLADRQRMLSQRIANNYLLRSWGVESSAVREILESSAKDFSAGLAKLSARQNSEEVRRELEEVGQQWEWLQASMAVEGASPYRLIVAESADAILEAADRVTSLFEQQSRR
jgi:hypothetical protein